MNDLTEKIRQCAVLIQDRADRLDDAHCDRQFLEASMDLKDLARRLERLAGKVYPRGRGDG